MQPHVSVLMPSYEQAPFLPRALASLQAQSLDGWEAVIVDASPTDATRAAAAPWLDDPRVRFLRIAEGGLGRALNVALDAARAPLVAYLPCDDLYHRDHLREVADVLQAAPHAVLAFSGVRHHYNREAPGGIEGEALQLVQCMHRRVDARWSRCICTVWASCALLSITRTSTAETALDLRTYLAQVRERNPVIQSARARVSALEQRVWPARAWDDPFVAIGPDEFTTEEDRADIVRYQVTQTIPFPGKRGARGDSDTLPALITAR